jgi:hypothetical protein
VSPARLVDTRPGAHTADGQYAGGGKVAPNGTISVLVGGRLGVPADATAVVLNVTAIDATSPGFVQVFPTNQAAVGASSNLNIESQGQIIPNLVAVPLGQGGRVSLFTQGGAYFAVDLFGYFVGAATSSDGRYQAVTPTRIMDTRGKTGVQLPNPGDTRNCSDFATWSAANFFFWRYKQLGYSDIAVLDGNNDNIPCESLPGNPGHPVQPPDLFEFAKGEARTLTVLGRGGVPAGGVQAVVLNVTSAWAVGSGYVQVIPTTGATPLGASSNLNVRAGQTIANLVIVPVGAGGNVTLYDQAGGHLIVDVFGYFTDATTTASSSGLFVALTPGRLLDTRSGLRPGAGSLSTFTPLGHQGIPGSGVSGVFLNLTATQTGGPGFVQAIPSGLAAPGAFSNLNVEHTNQTIPNAAISPLGAGGQISLYTSAPTHLIADTSGYFTS